LLHKSSGQSRAMLSNKQQFNSNDMSTNHIMRTNVLCCYHNYITCMHSRC